MLLNYIGNLIIITVKESSVQGIWCLNTSSDHIMSDKKWIRCVTQFHRQWDELETVRTGMYCIYVYGHQSSVPSFAMAVLSGDIRNDIWFCHWHRKQRFIILMIDTNTEVRQQGKEIYDGQGRKQDT